MYLCAIGYPKTHFGLLLKIFVKSMAFNQEIGNSGEVHCLPRTCIYQDMCTLHRNFTLALRACPSSMISSNIYCIIHLRPDKSTTIRQIHMTSRQENFLSMGALVSRWANIFRIWKMSIYVSQFILTVLLVLLEMSSPLALQDGQKPHTHTLLTGGDSGTRQYRKENSLRLVRPIKGCYSDQQQQWWHGLAYFIFSRVWAIHIHVHIYETTKPTAVIDFWNTNAELCMENRHYNDTVLKCLTILGWVLNLTF